MKPPANKGGTNKGFPGKILMTSQGKNFGYLGNNFPKILPGKIVDIF